MNSRAQSALDLPLSKVESVKAAAGVVVTAEAAEYGRRSVKAVQYGSLRLHIKPRPEMPAVEFAVAAFLNRLLGELVAPSSCLAIMHEKQIHSALFSQTVPGQTLCKAMKEDDFQQRLNKRQTSAQILGAMLVHPEDGKADNYMVMPKLSERGEIEDYIIAIDNDHAFVNPLAADGTLLVKSILFCLELMREPVHPAWRDRITGLSIEFFLREWFKEIEFYQRKAHAIFDKDARKCLQYVGFFNSGKSPVVITFPLYEEAVIALWDRFTQLQEILRRTPTITHLALLKQLDPALGRLYGKAFEEFPLPEKVEERFKLLCAKSYGKQWQTLSTTVEVQKAMQLPEKQRKAIETQNDVLLFTPTDALKTLDDLSKEAMHKIAILNEFYEKGYSNLLIQLSSKTLQMQIVNELDFTLYVNKDKSNGIHSWDIAKQQRTLHCIAQAKIPFTRLIIAHCAGLTVSHLKAILAESKGLAYLKLVDCPNLTNELFSILSRYDKNLIALTIIQCHSITNSDWGVDKPNFYDLEFVRIEDNLQLEKISLSISRLKRLKVDKNLRLKSLIINGDELLQRDALGRTSLLQAVANGDIKQLDRLLSCYLSHISLMEKDGEGNTALLLAVKTQQMKMLDHWLRFYFNRIPLKDQKNDIKITLFWIIKNEKIIVLDHLLLHHADRFSLMERDNDGNTVFLYAIKNGKILMVQHLLLNYPKQGSFKEKDSYGRTALLVAVVNGQIDMINYLLQYYSKHVSLQQKDNDGKTVLLLAAQYGQIATLDYLLLKQALWFPFNDRSSSGAAVLLLAVENGQIAMVDHLLLHYSKQVSLKEIDNYGRTPLLAAIANGQIGMVDHLLLQYSQQVSFSDKDNDGSTALFCAVKNDKPEMVDHLLLHYSDWVSMNERDKDGNTLLLYAVKNGKTRMVDHLLLHYSKQVSLKEIDNYGHTPLLAAVASGQIGMVDHLLLQYSQQIPFNDKDNDGSTALFCAVKNDKPEMVDHLLLQYSDWVSINERDKDGNTLLLYAVKNGKIRMVDHLLRHYSQQISLSDRDNDEISALFCAVKSNQLEMVHHLLSRYHSSVLLNEKDKDENTVLLWAIKNGRTLMVDCLLLYCPNLEAEIVLKALHKEKMGNDVSRSQGKLQECSFTLNTLRRKLESVDLTLGYNQKKENGIKIEGPQNEIIVASPHIRKVTETLKEIKNFYSTPNMQLKVSIYKSCFFRHNGEETDCYLEMQKSLVYLKKTLAVQEQVLVDELPNFQKYFLEMSAYVANLQLQKESMATFLENKENHKWLTPILDLAILMRRAFAALAKPWSIAERTIDLSLDPNKPLRCDVFSELPKLAELYDAVQAILAPRDKISAEQRCVIDLARETADYYTHFISTRAALQKIASKENFNFLFSRGSCLLNGTYREYDANLPTLLERIRSVSSQVCGKRNNLADTICVNEAQFEEMAEIHGGLKGLEAKIVEQKEVLNEARNWYETPVQKVKALEDEIAELQTSLDFAVQQGSVYITRVKGFRPESG